ncbi:8-oxo-dGTP pyrophosphatase MutT (NUDIX family) [Spinactinospora alkalitolerans]|uniref:8-oxo-dGTP pyrophosphatase MutT (NUDIX family) n=1 Tax=Spinactinospora alkalitolerans TaxID=687207 RepID=A0A852U0Q0_9ACTN|nr:NUDIX domain-containing protein [Spinactinospora alkalitolerans]NYE49809.1 8-oxo-dGTP pyrophosphatase MutT (NUDIX family) [Spinactinospora alkalitolerans]
MAAEVRVGTGIEIPPVDEGRRWVVGAVITDGRGRAFAQRRAPHRRIFPDSWDIVGGHVEAGETVLEALGREIAEETGWALTEVVADLGSLVWTPDDGIERFEVDYLVRVEGDLDAPALEWDRHTEFAWVGDDQLDLLADRNDPTHTFVADIVALGLTLSSDLGHRGS